MTKLTLNAILAIGGIAALLMPVGANANDSFDCPRTLGSDKTFSEPWPQSDYWYGSEALAVVLTADGTMGTTGPEYNLTAKIFWYSAGFEPGMEVDFVGRIERLDDGPNDAMITSATNAGFGGNWTILTGLRFSSFGCWKVIGEYRGQTLEFVIETKESANRN